MSLQLQPVLTAADHGERWPFGAVFPFMIIGSDLVIVLVGDLAAVSALIFRSLIGLLLFDLALLMSGFESSSSSIPSSIGNGVVILFFVEERVTGPK